MKKQFVLLAVFSFLILSTSSWAQSGLNGTPVGNTTPSTGKFTNLEATTDFTLNGETATSFDNLSANTATNINQDAAISANTSTNASQDIAIAAAGVANASQEVSILENTTSLETNTTNVMLNAFRTAENGNRPVLKMANGMVDAFEDESGVDLPASIDEEYDSTSNFYSSITNFGDLTPTMTGPTSPTGTASGSSDAYPYQAFGLFSDDNDGRTWRVLPFVVGSWVQFSFDNGLGAKVINEYTIKGNQNVTDRSPKNWTLEASHNGQFAGEQDVLDTRSNVSFSLSELKTFTFTNTTAYTHYRLVFGPGPVNGILDFQEWELKNSSGLSNNMTLFSNSQTANTQSNEAQIVLFAEDVAANIIINTDLKAYVSRDGGTTFTQVTLSDAGEFEKGNLLTGTVDISSQPSGTDMQWKVETDNNKALNLHGVGLEWR